jgi:hypothetical protein
VSCACGPPRWLVGGRQPSGGRCTRAHFGEGANTRSPKEPRRSSRLRPRVTDRVASMSKDRLRPSSKHRGSARSRASARARVKLVAAMFASAQSLVAAWCEECRLRSTHDTAQTPLFEYPDSQSNGVARTAVEARIEHLRVRESRPETWHSLRAA